MPRLILHKRFKKPKQTKSIYQAVLRVRVPRHMVNDFCDAKGSFVVLLLNLVSNTTWAAPATHPGVYQKEAKHLSLGLWFRILFFFSFALRGKEKKKEKWTWFVCKCPRCSAFSRAAALSRGRLPCQPRCFHQRLHETRLQRAVAEITTTVNGKMSLYVFIQFCLFFS